MQNKGFTKIIFFLALLIGWSLEGQALHVYTLYDHGNGGEKGQAAGIVSALRTLSHDPFSFDEIDTKTMDSLKIQGKIIKTLEQDSTLVIGIGEGGIAGIQDLRFSHPKLTVCLASHMAFPGYEGLEDKIDVLAIPTHAASDQLRKTWGGKLLETIGVAHNRTPGAVDQVYRDYGALIPKGCSSYFGVVLGGDVPLPAPSKHIRHFTEEEAQKLATYVATHANGACVLVLNGPRTGKYKPDGTEDTTVHREGRSDPVTTHFMTFLKDHRVNAHLFDFQHGNKLPYNTFELVLGALRASDGSLLVGGDSTSMVSEARDLLPSDHVIVYTNKAMDTVHQAHIISEQTAGRVAVLNDYQTLTEPTSSGAILSESTATTIAKKIWAVHQTKSQSTLGKR